MSFTDEDIFNYGNTAEEDELVEGDSEMQDCPDHLEHSIIKENEL